MISPKLEQLIWEGKAFFKTYVAGPQKSTLNIDNDRFIIITDITMGGYSDSFNTPNIQLNIYGEKGFNHYFFRTMDKYTIPVFDGGGVINFDALKCTTPQTINTYLLHTTAVGFSFIPFGQLAGLVNGVASVSNPSLAPLLDYGKDGDVGAVPIALQQTLAGMTNFFVNRENFALPAGVVTTQQLQIPAVSTADATTRGFCFANINYIEILGKPENMQF